MSERSFTLAVALTLAGASVCAGVLWSDWWLLASAVAAGTAASWLLTAPRP